MRKYKKTKFNKKWQIWKIRKDYCTGVERWYYSDWINNTLFERIKLNKHLTTHIFRHTHVSKLAELGVPLNVIKDRVGHESSDITERIYLHVTKNMKREMVEKLDLL